MYIVQNGPVHMNGDRPHPQVKLEEKPGKPMSDSDCWSVSGETINLGGDGLNVGKGAYVVGLRNANGDLAEAILSLQ